MATIMVTMVAMVIQETMAVDQVDTQAPVLDPNTEMATTTTIKVPPHHQMLANTLGPVVGTAREIMEGAL